MSGVTVLTLVRHGETEANVAGIFHGVTDGPLTERGVQQAERLAARLVDDPRRPTALYSSPLGRAMRTADILDAGLGLGVRVLPALAEVDLGSWEGLTFDELETAKRHLEGCRRDPDFAPHGGESPRRLGARVAAALEELARQHTGERILVVSHGGALCAGLAVLLGATTVLGEEYRMGNCAVSELILDPRPRLTLLDCRQHL